MNDSARSRRSLSDHTFVRGANDDKRPSRDARHVDVQLFRQVMIFVREPQQSAVAGEAVKQVVEKPEKVECGDPYQDREPRPGHTACSRRASGQGTHALEYLDNSLTGALRRDVFAVIDDAPPEEPPGEISSSQGFFVRPWSSFTVVARKENSGVLVRPITTMPAATGSADRK